MPYLVKQTTGNLLVTINDFTANSTSTSITLVGRGVPNAGTVLATNLVQMLENFADNLAPRSPLIGQIWFNATDSNLYYYTTSGWIMMSTANSVIYTSSPITINDNDGDSSILGAGLLTLTRRLDKIPSGPQIFFKTYLPTYSLTVPAITVATLGVTSNDTLQYNGLDNLIIQTSTNNQLRFVDNNSTYGAIFNNDGSNLNILLTNNGQAFGSTNSLRPLIINLSTGLITISNGLNANNLSLSSSLYAALPSTFNDDLYVNGNLYATLVPKGTLFANAVNIHGVDLLTLISETTGSLSGYLPITGGTLTGPGNLTVNGNITANSAVSIAGNLSGTSAGFSGSITANGGKIGAILNSTDPCIYAYRIDATLGGGIMCTSDHNLSFVSTNNVGNWINTLGYFEWNGNFHSSNAIIASGDVTAFSDIKLKENITTITDGLDIIKHIRGVRFDRKDTKQKGIGVIAQEIADYIPEVVHDSNGTLSVAYGNIVGVLIEAIKTLSTKVDELEYKLLNNNIN